MPTPAPADVTTRFRRNLPFLNENGSDGFSFTPPSDSAVVQAILQNKPFPDKPVRFAEVNLRPSSGKPIIFSRNGADSISFEAKADSFAGFGVYTESSQLVEELPADQFVLPAFDFDLADSQCLSAIRWGFDASAKASGAMALGAAGAATLRAEASGQGLFAVIRRLPKATGALDVIRKTADSWRIPRQVHTADDLDPGTWLLVDLLGSVSIKLGAQLGFDFNWLRELALGEISGDIGLRVQLGLSATLGFQAGGKLALIISRETEESKLRLRLVRLRSRQFNCAFSAAAVVDAKVPELSQNADDFIKAVFGVHGQQILSSLKALEKWTDKNTKLSDLLSENRLDGAQKLIAELAGIPENRLQTSFDSVHDRVTSFIQRWHELPHNLSSNLLRNIDEKIDLDPIKDIAKELSTIDSAGLRKLLEERLSSVSFFDSPVGKYLESLAGGPVLNLLGEPLKDVRSLAELTLKVLDGSVMEDVLRTFQIYAQQFLNVSRVLDATTKADFKTLDGLLKRRLADFLGKTVIDSADFDRLRTAVGELVRKRQEFYEKALEALRRQYNFELTRTFQKTATDQALLDVTFDFSRDPLGVRTFFDAAIRGNFDFLLANPHPDITIGLGELSHGITRQTHTEITLPFMRGEIDHINQSIANAKIEERDGRVIVYTLNSSDRIANDERISVLTLAMGLAAEGVGSGRLRVHQNKLELSYTMTYAKRDLEKKDLLARLKPIAKAYFPAQMKSPAAFVEYLDGRTEEVIVNGPKALGSALVSLQVVMPEEAAAIAGQAWIRLSADKKDPRYAAMATSIRSRLRNFILSSYFTEAERFRDLDSARVLLVYGSLDPAVALDFMNREAVSAAIRRKATGERLVDLLKGFQDVLQDAQWRKFFRPADADTIRGAVSAADPRFTGMLFVEARLIDHAVKAGLAIGKFMKKSGEKPTEAVKALSEFGANLTRAFNSDIVSVYVGDSIRAVGTEVFLAATRGILGQRDGNQLPEEGANAMLTIEFMKPEKIFDPKVLLARGRMADDEVILAERLVEA